MRDDPVISNPSLYQVVMENDRVRVLEYRDRPGDRTTPHRHPDSVMITLSSFRRRLVDGERTVDVDLDAGVTRWLAAQVHAGENIGETETHVMFIELKEPAFGPTGPEPALGPHAG
jgi:beta-alanine degradation protein BauB